jgi:CRP/FNR family transcriptional regulator, transcriptional activator FtrB
MFERLSTPLLRRLDAVTELVQLPSGQVLGRQGEVPAVLHILLDGQVALSAAATDGTDAVVEVVQPPTHFILAAALTGLPYLMSATTITPSRLLTVQAPALRSLIHTELDLATAMLGAVSRDYRAMVRQVRDLRLRTAAQRLGCYLLARITDETAGVARFRLPFEKSLLASRLGCRQDSLSRAFATLRDYGVETHGGMVIIHDIARLRLFSLPDEIEEQNVLSP